MADNWDDDDDDDWDKSDDDDELAAKLSKLQSNVPTFEDEEDLALKEKAEQDRLQTMESKIRGKALAEKKQKESDAKEELELARRAMELEAEAEAKMTPDERRQLERQRIEAADNELTDDLFGADNTKNKTTAAAAAGDAVVLKDLKDHLKHARKVGDAMKKHGNVHFASAFFKECVTSSKDVLDDDAVTELIKTLNVIKNEKVQAAKRKVKGQAQKSKKVDKVAEAKARQKLIETFGDNDKFDQYDEYGEKYEDDFF